MTTESFRARRWMDDPAQVLKEILIEKKARNPSFSARALARDLGLSQPFLSQVMSRRKNLSLEQKLRLASLLGITIQKAEFAEITPAAQARFDLFRHTAEHDRILQHWYHFAILELSRTDFARATTEEIAQHLGITLLEAEDAISRLIEFGYLERLEDGSLNKTQNTFLIDAKRSSYALRQCHRSRLEAAAEEITDAHPERVASRYFQTMFLTSSRERVATARRVLQEVQTQLIAYLSEGPQEEVFQWTAQLFPVSKSRKPSNQSQKSKSRSLKKGKSS